MLDINELIDDLYKVSDLVQNGRVEDVQDLLDNIICELEILQNPDPEEDGEWNV